MLDPSLHVLNLELYVSESTAQGYISVCKSKLFVLRAHSVDLGYARVHTAMVQLKAPMPLPFHVIVGKGSWLQDG